MLLGDSDLSLPANKDRPFAGGLDVLHATSAALIDGMREILLDSDFENAMKVLTSWIPGAVDEGHEGGVEVETWEEESLR
jgi:phosphosulfolactate phosphohydrolase-like enzyme